MSDKFDLVVIGGGPGGYVASIRAAQLGFKVACVEKRERLGGTCLNVGCIPSKNLLDTSHLYHEMEVNFANKGINVTGGSMDVAKMMANKDKVVDELGKGIDYLFKKNKITRFVGIGTILNNKEVAIHGKDGDKKIATDRILIATGSDVISLPNVKIDEEVIVSSTGALTLKKVPKKMIVIGAGVIGLELGSVWSRLGASVEVIEYADKICPSMDKDVSIGFKKILEKQGFVFKLESKVLSVEKKKNSAVVEFENIKTGNKEKIEADIVLVAIGRKPYTDSLGLKEAGVKLNERGFIEINDKFETSVKNIYAIGDVVVGPMLAHKAEEEGVVCTEIMAGQYGHINHLLIPSVVYTNPEVASVGYTEQDLKAKNITYKVGKFSFVANSRAKAIDTTDGFVKVLACEKTDKVLGCHIIGRDAGTLIHEVAVLMEFGGSSEDLARTCHAHPTLNEAIKEACLDVDKRAIHS